MSGKFRFDYDAENDLLYLYNPAKKSKGSVEFGELIIDLEKKGGIAGIEIFGASKYLSELTNKRISKRALKNLENASVSHSSRNGTVMIKIVLRIEKEEILAPVAIQDMRYNSPVLAVAK